MSHGGCSYPPAVNNTGAEYISNEERRNIARQLEALNGSYSNNDDLCFLQQYYSNVQQRAVLEYHRTMKLSKDKHNSKLLLLEDV